MRVYLDNCCLNRPFDDQMQFRIRLETEGKLRIQERIVLHELDLVWSYVLEYENMACPIELRRKAVARWKRYAVTNVDETSEIVARAVGIAQRGLRSKDALHVACAVAEGCAYFITTDDSIIRKLGNYTEVLAVDPTAFIRITEP